MEDFIDQQDKEQSYNKDKKKRIIEILNAIIFVLIGLINIVYANKLTNILPTIIGSTMILTSGIMLIYNISQKEYKSLATMKIPKNIVSIILGISILLIYNPFEKITEHLVLLGIEMVINSIKFMFKDEIYKDIDD